VPLGQFGHYELFVDPQEQRKFPQFAVFILAAATQSDSSNSGGAGGNSNAQSNKPPPGTMIPQSSVCTPDAAGNLFCTQTQ
jgi:hypothetical protein